MKNSANPANTMMSQATTYLAQRHSLGFDLKISGLILMSFARFADAMMHRGPITEELTLAWAHSTKSESAITWARRIEVIRPFAKYLKQFSPDTIVPRRDLCGRAHRRLAPHIYTEQELNELVAASAALLPAGSIRPLTDEALFGLIAATGLRISTLLQDFFLERLMEHRGVSPETISSYCDSFCLFLQFASERLSRCPSDWP
ncbi:hypothetical protein [Burkholderia sp. SRS-W-2-2016]|uniref:hypothetical protein n=1 Tax=Burkholderia sp. SRS-W-2-2016 TaxID=1926878 RepID=UPI000B04E45F|nr:hypothetical protein [Burkholderia sp. SRS-W-2-2016]